MVYYTTYVVHTKIFFWDFDNDSYAQNSEIILTIRIQKNFFKIPIGKFFEKLSKSKKKKIVCTTYVVYYTTFVVYKKYFFWILGIKTMPKIQELFIFSESERFFSRFQLEVRFSNFASMNHLYSPCLLYTIPQMWYTTHNLYTTYVV